MINLSDLAISVSKTTGKAYEARESLQSFLDRQDLDYKHLPGNRVIALIDATTKLNTGRQLTVSSAITEELNAKTISVRKVLQCEVGSQTSTTGEKYYQLNMPAKNSNTQEGVLARLAAGTLTHDDLVG